MTEFHTVFLDLDDTLYPHGNGVWHAIGERITLFMVQRMGLSEAEAVLLRREYFQRYGTTLNGLQIHFQIDPADYLGFVHDIPLERFLRTDPALDQMLAQVRAQQVVFTNADRGHAERVLRLLGIEKRIGKIVDIYALEFQNKPELGAYLRAMRLSNCQTAEGCLLVDDMPRNLHPASGLGMTTVYVGPDSPPGSIDYRINRIHHLTRAVPSLTAGPATGKPEELVAQ
jgi:putative hydrolase of the HAD superfamily